jgi:hypothetical protein
VSRLSPMVHGDGIAKAFRSQVLQRRKNTTHEKHQHSHLQISLRSAAVWLSIV